MSKFFYWILFVISIQILIWLIWFKAYELWYFNDNWLWNIEINKNNKLDITDNVSINNLNELNESIKQITWNNNFIVNYTWNKIIVNTNNIFELDQDIILFNYYFSKLLPREKEFFIAWKNLWYSFKDLLEKYNYIELEKTDIWKIKWDLYLWNYINNEKNIQTLKEKYESDLKKYNTYIKLYKNKNIDTCFNNYCNDKKEEYNYLRDAILNDKELIESLKLYEKQWINSKLFLSIIVIENLRIYSSYKWAFKRFLSYTTPQVSVMTKFSYWMYWTKVSMITRLINENYKWSIFYIWDDTIIEKIKKDFYRFNKTKYTYEPINEQKIIDFIVSSKKNQTDIVAAFIKMQTKWWNTKWINLLDNNNIWYLLTLYNIWQFNEPHKNPELWWADLDFLSKPYNFWQLSLYLYNSLDFEYIRSIVNK